jgi:hypothetical protein
LSCGAATARGLRRAGDAVRVRAFARRGLGAGSARRRERRGALV